MAGKDVGLHRRWDERAVQTLAEVYEDRAEDYTRTAERTDDLMFRNMLLMLALQWRLAAQEEASKQPTEWSWCYGGWERVSPVLQPLPTH